MQPIDHEVILIGAGPIGLELAVSLKLAGVDYRHIEANQVGHTISWFPRQVRFFSSPERIAICGVPLMTTDQSKASREEYLTYLHAIARQFNLAINTYERVTEIRPPVEPPATSGNDDRDRFLVTTQRSDGTSSYRARRVILAIGDMHWPRPLENPEIGPVPGRELPHVSQHFDEPHPYIGQRLLIVGGKNSAVEAAIRCYRAGAHVSISYRRAEFDKSIKYWLKPEIEWLIKHGDIGFYPTTVPVNIEPKTVTLCKTRDGVIPAPRERELLEVPTDFVLSLIGFDMDTRLLEMAGVRLQGPNRAPSVNVETMETNVPGLYVAGTAVAGTQIRYKLFIENCHSHVVKIVRAIAGCDPSQINPLGYERIDENPRIAET